MPGQLSLTGRRRRGALAVTYVTNQLPYPAHSGGQLREAQLLARVGATVDVDLFVLTESFERDARHADMAAAHCTSVRLFESTPTPPDAPPGAIPERVWRYQSAAFDTALKTHLAACPPDVVHIEGYFLAEHLPPEPRVPLVIVEENVEYLIDRDHQRDGQGSCGTGAPWPVSRKIEYAALSRATLAGAVCEEDADTIRRDAPWLAVSVFPNGSDHLGSGQEGTDERGTGGAGSGQVTFVGNYSWRPTLAGAWSLVRAIWPRVLTPHPTARLALVGAGIPGELRAAAEAVTGLQGVGEVPAVRPVLAATDIFVCPLWMRSGIKVKMLEALSAGCAVVCTTAALRGLPAEVGQAVVTADDPDRFAQAIGTLVDDPAQRRHLSQLARRALDSFPTWDDAAEILLRGWRDAASTAGKAT